MTKDKPMQTSSEGHGRPDGRIDEPARREMVARIIDIFRTGGAEAYLGEAVTMAEHMLQSAHFAAESEADEATVIAALLHDIGHFAQGHFARGRGAFAMNDTADRMHEDAGAGVLEGTFPRIVVDCVRYHVAAKRYLCAAEGGYYDGLSDASKHSLRLQGGAMDATECAAFEAIPDFEKVILVRRCDDRGKVPGLDVPPLEHYLPMLHRVAGLAWDEGDEGAR